MLPPGGSVDSWYMMRAARQPFLSCFRRSQKEVQKRRESSLQINVRGIAGSAFKQRAYLAQERVHLLWAATDIGLWPQQNGEVFCMHGKSRLCRQLLQKVAGRAFLHPCGGRVGTAADHLVQLLTVPAAFDGLHQQIFRGDEWEVFPNGLADDRLIYNKSVGHIPAETQDRLSLIHI